MYKTECVIESFLSSGSRNLSREAAITLRSGKNLQTYIDVSFPVGGPGSPYGRSQRIGLPQPSKMLKQRKVSAKRLP